MTWVQIPPGVAHFFFEKKSEPFQLTLLYCLALFNVSQLFNHVCVCLCVCHSLVVMVK